MNITLQKLICSLENHYPDDNLITCYNDFLKIRDYLTYYQFNPIVFRSLVELTDNLWETPKRINRLSMLSAIQQYGKDKVDYAALAIHTRKLIFELFKNTLEKAQFLTEKQIVEAQKISGSLLSNLPLTNEEETWLCENQNQSNFILNRILRYPVSSKAISSWVKEQFHADKFHVRRAEAIGWLLDDNPDFVIDKQTMLDDFEYINKIDTEIISNEAGYGNTAMLSSNAKGFGSRYRLTYRPYITINYQYPHYKSKIEPCPDFSELRKYFSENIDKITKQTMLWAVAYSHLDANQKTELLKKYYSDDLFFSLLKIGKRCKLIGMLKWLQTREISNTEFSKSKVMELEIRNIRCDENLPF